MKMLFNDVIFESFEKGIYKKFFFLKDQVEVLFEINKLILFIFVQEIFLKIIYRKDLESKKIIIEGMNLNGVEEFFFIGDMLGIIFNDVFVDINIYDDDICLL